MQTKHVLDIELVRGESNCAISAAFLSLNSKVERIFAAVLIIMKMRD